MLGDKKKWPSFAKETKSEQTGHGYVAELEKVSRPRSALAGDLDELQIGDEEREAEEEKTGGGEGGGGRADALEENPGEKTESEGDTGKSKSERSRESLKRGEKSTVVRAFYMIRLSCIEDEVDTEIS